MKAFQIQVVLLFLFFNNMYGQFLPISDLANLNEGEQLFFDVNFDGFTDIAYVVYSTNSSNYLQKTIRWRENDGLGNFGTSKKLIQQEYEIDKFRLSDIDKDGDVDVLIWGTIGHDCYIFENQGDDTFENMGRIIEGNYKWLYYIEFHDLNNDGYDDILYSYLDSENEVPGFYVLLNNGDNTFTDRIEGEPGANYGSHRFRVIDLDQDGIVDVVGQPTKVSTYSGRIFFWKGLGNGTFGSRKTLVGFTNNEYASTFDIGDIDNDGDLDIVAGKYIYGIDVFKNDGNENFKKEGNLKGLTTHAQVLFVDVDMDGDLDIVADSNNGTSSIPKTFTYWYENYGQGLYSAAKTLFTNEEDIDEIFAIDVDKDGDKDIIGQRSRSTFFIRKNVYNNPYVEGKIYIDENKNLILDEVDVLLFQNVLDIVPSPTAVEILPDSTHRFYLNKGVTTITPSKDNCFSTLNGQSEIIQIIDSIENYSYDFGLIRESELIDFESFISSQPTRCGFDVDFNLSTLNSGCSKQSNIEIRLVKSPLAVLLESSPSFTKSVGDTLIWEFENIEVGRAENIRLKFKIAGTEHMGDFIEMPVFTILKDGDERSEIHRSLFRSEIRCAYDPNDKLVQPYRDDRNYTLQSEDLMYTIRFQNTGNDTAFTVELRDKLDPNLDPTSIRFLGASHDFKTRYNVIDNEYSVIFNDILLPDSTTDLRGSQGYVNFIIEQKDTLDYKVEIYNQAEIYFDYNPPIRTNLTKNTIVNRFNCKDSINTDGFFTIPLSVETFVRNVSCFNHSDGYIEIIPQYGTLGYNINGQDVNSYIDTMLIPDVYQYIVKDSGGCIDTLNYTIGEPEEILVDVNITQPTDGKGNGSIYLGVAGGTPPYSFNWSNGGDGKWQSDLFAGNYTVEIEDSNGCAEVVEIYLEGLVNTSVPKYKDLIKVYPNPNSGNIKIEVNKDGGYQFKVYDSMGKKIFEDSSQISNKIMILDGSIFPTDGCYRLVLTSKDSIVHKTIIRI